MSYKTICETDADILINFKLLNKDGFAFVYAKKEDGILQQFVNCNGKIFGPFAKVDDFFENAGETSWTAYKGDSILKYFEDGKKCKIETPPEKRSYISQEEIDNLLSAVSTKEAELPEEVYDEEYHTLKIPRKNQEFFITEKKKYGPYYGIFAVLYQDDEHFQFTYKKRQNSNNWYYNYNGKEIGPFRWDSDAYLNIDYDEKNRAVLDLFYKGNFLYINGEKIKCFDAPYSYCLLWDNGGHEIFSGRDDNDNYHLKRDGIEPDFSIDEFHILPNGDIVYSKIENETETWFYNDTPISITVNGRRSSIQNSTIEYRRNLYKDGPCVPYFMKQGKEYNGLFHEYNCSRYAIWLQDGKILSKIQSGSPYGGLYDHHDTIRNGNFLRLYYTNTLAGRD